MKKYIIISAFLIVAVFTFYNLKETSSNSSNIVKANEEKVTVMESESGETDVALAEEISVGEGTSEELKQKMLLLREILQNKNDNDPRLDTEFRNLSAIEKAHIVEMYQSLRPESLNNKGTLVFLIGREISKPEDAEFLKGVLSEEPCLSLENCGVPNGARDHHMDSINNVTLSYPQLVALNRIKAFIQKENLQTVNPVILNHLADALKMGQNSKISVVRARSKELLNLLDKPRN